MKKLLYALFILSLFNGCADSAIGPNGGVGQGGSLARFAIVGNYLYTVSPDSLTTFDISNPSMVTRTSGLSLNFMEVETIFPFNNNLFLGTQWGMNIVGLQDPQNPKLLSTYSHIRSCDPVVTDGITAFVTLRSGTQCWNTINQLDILDVSNFTSPQWITSYPMTNPKGLGLRGKELFICDAGLKIYDVTDLHSIQLKGTFNIPANDVIVHPDKIIVIADDGLYQYASTVDGINLLSTFLFSNL